MVALVVALALAQGAPPNAPSLWQAGQGPVYEVRIDGGELWAQSDAQIVHGWIEGSTVKAGWTDLARTGERASGQVTFKLAPDRMTVVDATGGFPRNAWMRLPIPAGALRLDWASTVASLRPKAWCFSGWCPPGGASGSVWGTEVYTSDSSICTAAVHAGLIHPQQGGVVTVRRRGGQEAFKGSERNGVATRDWRSWPEAFTFAAACSQDQAFPGATLPSAIRATGATRPGAFLGEPGSRVWFDCERDVPGRVWGSGPYTDDSSVCGAATHAGLLGPNGGLVLIEAVAPPGSYPGSAANGVTTHPWGAWPRAFKVQDLRALPAEREP